jgi:hypothetical protein
MAVSALILIVVMIGLAFQQAHSAWGTGIRQSGLEGTLRVIMARIENDLSHAVDATAFKQTSSFLPGSAEFYVLNGTNRFPQKVVYSYTGTDLTRTTYEFASVDPSGQWQFPTLSSSAVLNGKQVINSFAFTIHDGAGTGGQDLPLRVEAEAHARKAETFSLVSGWSEGRGRPGHELEDRIVATQ